MSELANHLWQSTLVAAAAALFAVALRRHRARVRAAIWLFASLKFLVPLFALVAIGRAVPWPAMRAVASSDAVAAVETISQPFGTVHWDTSPRETPRTSAGASVWSLAILMLWATGTIVVATAAIVRARRSRAILHGARAVRSGREADAVARVLQPRPGARFDLLVTDARVSPCVVGIRRPALLWPLRLTEHLSDAQLDAVIAHEIGHVERRDNLAAVGLNAVRALFWFHPGVWWLDSRWREERERACDERVLARDDDAEQYADGILKVGEFCVGAIAMDHARMAGARLTGRIEAIMNRNTPKALGWTGRTGLTIAMTVVVFGPVMFGATLPTRSTVGDQRTTAATDQSVTPSKEKGVSGVVTDATGGTIPGATVSVTPVGSTNAQSVMSRADGRFAIADLADGEYDVRVQLPGFRTFTRRVQVGGTSGAFLTVELAVGSVTETVTVKAVQPEPSPAPISEGEWQEALNRDPGNPRLYFELAHLYYQRERFVESDSLTKRAVDLMTQGLAPEPVTRVTSGQAVGGNIKEPRKIRDLKPVYPSAALASNVTGVVVLEAMIGRAGTVGDVRVLRSVPELDQAAASAVRQWLFTPTYLNGRPIDVTMTVTVNFWK